jgi:hypothetical protein
MVALGTMLGPLPWTMTLICLEHQLAALVVARYAAVIVDQHGYSL